MCVHTHICTHRDKANHGPQTVNQMITDMKPTHMKYSVYHRTQRKGLTVESTHQHQEKQQEKVHKAARGSGSKIRDGILMGKGFPGREVSGISHFAQKGKANA